MSDSSSLLQSMSEVFQPSPRGVVGLVDDLLGLCRRQGLQLDWYAGQCRVRSVGVILEESIEVPVPGAIFRAALARLAALCNERNAGSVSPYGGQAEVTVDVDPATVCRVVFLNTPGERSVQLTRIEPADHPGEPRQAQECGLDRDPRVRVPAAR